MDPSDLLASQPGLSGKPHGQQETLSQNKGVWQLRDDTKHDACTQGLKSHIPAKVSASLLPGWGPQE